MYSSLESIEARFLELEKNLCDPAGTFICPPRPPVPTWLFEIKSDDIKYEIAAGCSSVAGISTSSITETTAATTTTNITTTRRSNESSTTSFSNGTLINDTSTVRSSISPENNTALVTTLSSLVTAVITNSSTTDLSGNDTGLSINNLMTDPITQPSPTTSPSGGDTTPLTTTDSPPFSSSSSALITKTTNPFVNTADSVPTTSVSEVLTSTLETTTKDGGLTPGSATIVASLVIAAVVVIFLIILVVVGCLRYHKKKKITPMSNGEPGNYLYSNQVKKRRWVGSGNPQIMAKHNMNGTTVVYDSPVHSERGEDVENGEETVPSERQQNDINQSQTFNGIVLPNTDNVTMETEDASLQVKHKKRKKKKKKKRSAKTADSDGDIQNIESLPPRQLPPLSTETEPV